MNTETNLIGTIFGVPYLRGVLALVGAAVIVFPLYERFVGHPRYEALLVQYAAEEATRLSRHMGAQLQHLDAIERNALPAEFDEAVAVAVADFGLEKLKVYGPTGEVAFSTEKADIGSINKGSYFHDIVAKGNPFTNVVRKKSATMDGRTVPADVVETYVPIMRGNQFLGAFELYFDITARRDGLDALLAQSTVAMGTLGAVLLAALLGALAKVGGAVRARAKAEAELRESEERFRNMAASAQDAIVEVDSLGHIAFWNKAATRIFGHPPAEAIGSNLVRLLVPPQLRADFAWVGDHGPGQPIEFSALHRDGHELPIEATIAPLHGPSGRHTIGILRDVTERKQAEQRLRRSEATVRAVMEKSVDAIVVMDQEGRLVEFNAAAEAIFGYRRADVIGRELAEIIIPEKLRDAHRQGLQRYQRNGDGPVLDRRVEVVGMRSDGTEFPVELAITEVRRDGIPLFSGFLRDISDRRKAEEETTNQLEFLRTLVEAIGSQYNP